MNKKEYFNEFKEGKRNLFFIVSNDYDDLLRSNNLIFRKVDDIQVSVIGFIEETEAEYFFNSVITDKNMWKIASIDVLTFDDFLNSLEMDFRENLVFEMV